MRLSRFSILLAVVYMLIFVSCKKGSDYTISPEQVDQVNSFTGGTIVDRFGASGPYKWVGSYGAPSGGGFKVKITVDGTPINREYKGVPGKVFFSENFENEAGDGFIIVKMRDYKPSDE